MSRSLVLSLVLSLAAAPLAAQTYEQLGAGARRFVSVPETHVVLEHVRVVDGTGAAPKDDQTIIIRDGRIAAMGPAASMKIPEGARRMDLAGHTVIPGIVGLHNHSYYTTSQRGSRDSDPADLRHPSDLRRRE